MLGQLVILSFYHSINLTTARIKKQELRINMGFNPLSFIFNLLPCILLDNFTVSAVSARHIWAEKVDELYELETNFPKRYLLNASK
jgi:hypothetical protein